MIIQLKEKNSKHSIQNISHIAGEKGIPLTSISTQTGTYLINQKLNISDPRIIKTLPGVSDVHYTEEDHTLVSKDWKKNTVITLKNGASIGGNQLALMAGPCSIESEKQVEAVARNLSKSNIKIMRGGVFKPRSSPYSFRGLGLDGLKMFYEICKAYNLAIVTEVMDIKQLEDMYPYVDIFQVGARNSQNFTLLDALGKTDKPILLKRGIAGTIDELLNSAEYIFSGGNEEIILCERGIRTYEKAYRNTFDINAIPILKKKTHLPVIADPSHGIGLRKHVPSIAMAAVAAGADGIIYEVHPQPERALSDSAQTLDFEEEREMLRRMKIMRDLILDSY